MIDNSWDTIHLQRKNLFSLPWLLREKHVTCGVLKIIQIITYRSLSSRSIFINSWQSAVIWCSFLACWSEIQYSIWCMKNENRLSKKEAVKQTVRWSKTHGKFHLCTSRNSWSTGLHSYGKSMSHHAQLKLLWQWHTGGSILTNSSCH